MALVYLCLVSHIPRHRYSSFLLKKLTRSHYNVLSGTKTHRCKGVLCHTRGYSNAREGLLIESSARESLTIFTMMTISSVDRVKPTRVLATTTDTSYLCLDSTCHKPEQFTAPSHTKVNQLRITNARLDHHQLTPTKKRS